MHNPADSNDWGWRVCKSSGARIIAVLLTLFGVSWANSVQAQNQAATANETQSTEENHSLSSGTSKPAKHPPADSGDSGAKVRPKPVEKPRKTPYLIGDIDEIDGAPFGEPSKTQGSEKSKPAQPDPLKLPDASEKTK